jgi:2-keto-4-pentenoate hydratase/2-oxohepta-3-ene-1,7-dioic acid hydratase in catechol pathway
LSTLSSHCLSGKNHALLTFAPSLLYSDMIFTVPQIVSFLSQGTTLPAGTIILTGTPPGVGAARKELLKAGDRFTVEILPHIGSLIVKFENEA